MNVYDFDGTIYDGESTFDFYFYCVKRHPLLLKFVFVVVFTLIKYKMRKVSEEELMSLCNKYVSEFIKLCPDALELAEKFWLTHEKKVKHFYYEMHNENDLIISASFGFYLRPIMKKLGIKNLLCSEVDLDIGEIKRLCYRKNKTQLFKENYPDVKIESFFTDSLNDLPMMRLAEKSYLVKGNKICSYNFVGETHE